MSDAKKESFKEKMLKVSEELDKEETSSTDLIKQKEAEAKKAEEKFSKQILDLLNKEHGLTKEQIDEWKEEYGNKVFIVRFDESETYVFRYITLPEWKKISKQVKESTYGSEEMLNELLFMKCVLYPNITPDYRATIAAGTMETLSLQIQVASNFIPQNAAIDMITKL